MIVVMALAEVGCCVLSGLAYAFAIHAFWWGEPWFSYAASGVSMMITAATFAIVREAEATRRDTREKMAAWRRGGG